jgi:predicted CXXCH cytochrome family protein
MRIGSRAVKRILFIGAGSALAFAMGGTGTAQADNGPHISTAATAAGSVNINTASGAGRCAACHRTHTAKAKMLLKAAQPALCYTCHGGGAGANTDVQNGTSGSSDLALRGGGFEYALIGADAASKTMSLPAAGSTRMGTAGQTVPVGASEATTSKHQIDGVTSGTMWGNGAISATANTGQAAVTLECGSCHDPHGNGNYRILKPVPVDAGALVSKEIAPAKAAVPAVVAVIGVVDDPATPLVNEFVAAVAAKAAVPAVPAVMSPGAAGVVIPDAATKKYTTVNYWDVADRTVPLTKGGTAPLATEADGYIANVSQWCSTCHTRYLAQAPAYETDSGDAVFTYRHTSNRIDKAGVSRPNCIQCHVSHGSNAQMTGAAVGLNPGDTPAPAGASRLLRVDQRGTCVMCHNM